MNTIDLSQNVPDNTFLRAIYEILSAPLKVEAIDSSLNQQYKTFTDGISTLRIGVRGGALVKDIELTALGFAGVKNTDWECLEGE